MADRSSDGEDSGDLAEVALPADRLPKTSATTNLLVADILVRSASTLFRESVEKRVAKASTQDEHEAQDLLDGRTLITALGLYGASKLATRSFPGLLIVTGGLLAKALYERGKSRQRRLNRSNAGTDEE